MQKCCILLLSLLFHTILCVEKIENFQKVTFSYKITEFKYKFTEPKLKEEKDVYFFFKFSYRLSVYLTIIDEDNNRQQVYVNTDSRYIAYKVPELKSQIYIFSINYDFYDSKTMIFIDNSKEIYTNLDSFLSLSFFTNEIKTVPLPLIFNIEAIEDKVYVSFYKGSSAEDIFEMCGMEMNEDECDFKGDLENMIFEKGKKYKLKYNYSKNDANNLYYFKGFTKSIYKEIGMGLKKFDYANMKEVYLIVDVKQFNNFYLYASYNSESNHFDFSYISESYKNSIMNGISVDIYFDEEWTKRYNHMEKEKDYLIVKFEEYESYISGYILTFSTYINIQYDQIFEVEKGTCGIIVKQSDYSSGLKYFLISSNSNIVELRSLLDADLTKVIRID